MEDKEMIRDGIEVRVEMTVDQPECGCQVVWELQWTERSVFPSDVLVRNFVACGLHAGDELHAAATAEGFRDAALDAINRMRRDAN